MANELTKMSPTMVAELKKRGISGQTWKVIKETVYPGASDESALMVYDYCKVRNLDVLKHPVHIVPIYDSKKKCMVDTVWQGISELRTTAMRTGQYAGCDETIYGDDVTEKFGNIEITYPEWAQVTVYRMVAGQRVPFHGGKVRWKETVSTTKDGVPNSMWRQRPYGQIEKCAEAAALRKAFPEELGNEYCAEEMGNKISNNPPKNDETVIDVFALKEPVAEKKEEIKEEIDPKLQELADKFYEEHKDEIDR
jgi:phage recombination protein Bet